MHVTPKILCIPPYISTPWENILSLQTKSENNAYSLLVTLKNSESVKIPGLDQSSINAVFDAHAQYTDSKQLTDLPFKLDESTKFLGNAMQHTPEQAELPDLPLNVLKKITQIVSTLGFEDGAVLPSAELNCNCVYCQVARGLQNASEAEEMITEHDLHFRDWEIEQTAEKLYLVKSPLDENEQYSVFLGTPLGCTCGQMNCEHIQAVLRS